MRGMYEEIYQKHLLKWGESYWGTFLPLCYQYTSFENRFCLLLNGRFQKYRKKFFYRDYRVFTKVFVEEPNNHSFSNHSQITMKLNETGL